MSIKTRSKVLAFIFIAIVIINLCVMAIGALNDWGIAVVVSGILLFMLTSLGCFVLTLFENKQVEEKKDEVIKKNSSRAKGKKTGSKNQTKKS